MLRSMTAFARATAEAEWGQATWEIRSVNNRYLDTVFRMPEELRALEPRIRSAISKRIQRGKIECNLRINMTARAEDSLRLDTVLARHLVEAAASLATLTASSESLRLGELLRWPGVILPTETDYGSLEPAIMELLEQTLGDLVATREREGAQIHAMVSQRCDAINAIVLAERPRQPALVAAARERLRQRLAEIMESLDHERIEQEIVILASKSDIAEELDRLETHVAEVRRVIDQPQAVGRRLDFLMQELNREANTFGSKSTCAESTRASVDLKVLIEQIREQIQNVE